MVDCYDKKDLLSCLQVRNILYKNIVQLLESNHIPSIPLNRHSDVVAKVLAYIESNAKSNLTVHQISKQLYVSESKLRTSFQTEVGVSIGQYIDQQVMSKARAMLLEKGKSIAQIASSLGFCDQFYFSRKFRKAQGITPSQYRKNLQHTKI